MLTSFAQPKAIKVKLSRKTEKSSWIS